MSAKKLEYIPVEQLEGDPKRDPQKTPKGNHRIIKVGKDL